MDFARAFSFMFKDADWFKKVAILALVSLIPIIGAFVLLGWGIEIARRMITGQGDDLLPDLDFGAQLGAGFKVWVIELVYAIPIFIFIIPIQVLPLLAASAQNSENATTTLATASVIISLCCGGLAFLYGIFLAYVMPAALGNFAAKGKIGDGLRFSEVFGLVKSAPVPFLMVLGGTIAAGIVASLGSVVCVIGVLLTSVYASAIVFHLTGQAYREATANKL